MSKHEEAETDKVYRGLLECPFRSGYIEFQFRRTDTVVQLLESIEERWGTRYEWATPEGFARDLPINLKVYGMVDGWLLAVEDESGAYVKLDRGAPIPVTAPRPTKTRQLPEEDGMHKGAVENGCYNWESFGYPKMSFRIPFKRTYELPDKSQFDVCLIALVLVNGG